jgi:NDP-sugar pyrophosphorylase family protein
MKECTQPAVFEVIRRLWTRLPGDQLSRLLPTSAESLESFYQHLKTFVECSRGTLNGYVDPRACVDGEIVSMGAGSVIEAGAIVHKSCRLVLGSGSVVRAGAILRDEVVVDRDCFIGAHCEVVRSLILGPATYLGHFNYVADSIIGRGVNVAGNVMIANTTVTKRPSILLVHNGRKIDSRRSHLGALVGDGVRFGASTTICPGCIVLPRLALPPSVTLYGTIDSARRRALMKRFAQTWASNARADGTFDASDGSTELIAARRT